MVLFVILLKGFCELIIKDLIVLNIYGTSVLSWKASEVTQTWLKNVWWWVQSLNFISQHPCVINSPLVLQEYCSSGRYPVLCFMGNVIGNCCSLNLYFPCGQRFKVDSFESQCQCLFKYNVDLFYVVIFLWLITTLFKGVYQSSMLTNSMDDSDPYYQMSTSWCCNIYKSVCKHCKEFKYYVVMTPILLLFCKVKCFPLPACTKLASSKPSDVPHWTLLFALVHPSKFLSRGTERPLCYKLKWHGGSWLSI